MSRTIDERIVEMRFDNNQFERGVQTSLGTLDKLKSALNFGGTAKSLDDIGNSMNGLNFGTAINGIQSLADHFSAFGVIGDQILRNIGDKIADFGFRVAGIAKNLSVDQIGVGFTKFEDLTKNTATLIGQGYDLSVVEKELERLNWFTDETSYNFTDMVQNIGKFTATGRDLTESVDAMEGIALWAALSGQNASVASRAMYQLSQAMGAGTMRLQDYRSIQNASMDTREFRQIALDAGVALGTLQKNADGTYTSIVEGATESTFTIDQFANHLTEEAWLTSDVMMAIFRKYASGVGPLYEYAEEHGITATEAIRELNGQMDEFAMKAFKAGQEARSWGDVLDSVKDAVSTGWMSTFKLIFGNYEEATALWSSLAESLYDVFTFGTDERNTLLEFWRNLGGRDKLVNAVTGSIQGFADALHSIDIPFLDVITEQNGIFDRLNEAREAAESKGLDPELAVEGMIKSAPGIERVYEILDKFSRVGAGVSAAFDIMKQAVSAFYEALKPLLSFLPKVGEKLLDIAANFGDHAVKIKEAAENSKFFTTIFQLLADTISPIAKLIGDAIMSVLDFVDNFTKVKEVSETVDELGEKVSPLVKIFGTLKTALTNFTKFLTGSFQMIKPIFDAVGETIKGFFKAIGDALARGDIKTATSVINGLLSGKVIFDLSRLSGALGDCGEELGEFFDKFRGMVGAREFVENVKNLAIAIGIFAASIFVLSTIETGKLFGVLVVIETLMYTLAKIMKFANGLESGKLKDTLTNFVNMLSLNSIASAVLIMALAAKLLSTIDFPGLLKGLFGVGALLVELSVAMRYLTSFAVTDKKVVSGLVGLAASLLIIAISLKKLAEMSVPELVKSVIAMGVILVELAGFSRISGGSFNGASFLAISVALLLICQSVKQLAAMKPDELSQGLAGLGVMLIELTAFAAIGSMMSSGLLMTAAAMVVLGVGIIELAAAVAIFAAIDQDKLLQGLAALGIALIELTAFGAVGSLVGVGMISTAAALLVMSAALVVLAVALAGLSAIPTDKLVLSFFALVAVFGLMATAGLLLGPMVPVLLAVSAALGVFGAAAVAVGAGIGAIGLGLNALAMGLTAIGEVIASINMFLAAAIGNTLKGILSLGKSVISFFKGDVKGAQKELEDADFETPVTKSMGKAANAAQAGSAKISKSAVKGLDDSKGLWETAVDGLTGLFSGKLEGAKDVVKENAAGLSKSAGEGLLSNKDLLSMISGENTDAILSAMTDKIPQATKAGSDLSQASADGSASKFKVHYNTGQDNAKAENSGYSSQNNNAYNTGATGAQKSADGSKSKWTVHYNAGQDNAKAENSGYSSQNGSAYNAGSSLGQSSANGSASTWQTHYNTGYNNAGAEASGMRANGTTVYNAGTYIGGRATSGSNVYSGQYSNGANAAIGMANGMYDNAWRVQNAASHLGSVTLSGTAGRLSIWSPSREMMKLGRFTSMGFSEGIENSLNYVADAAKNLAEVPLDALSGINDALMDAVASDFDETFTLTPVLDLSTARQQVAGLGGTVGLGTNLAYAAAGAENAAVGTLNPITLNIYGAQGQDVSTLADIVIDKLTSKLQRENSRWK